MAETDPANETAKASTGRKLVRLGENTPAYYVNNTEVGMTSWDVTLRLARIEKADSEALYIRDQAIITMSLHHAKAVAMILSAYIAQYESQNGPLAVPVPGSGLAPEQAGGKIEVDVPIALYPDEAQPAKAAPAEAEPAE